MIGFPPIFIVVVFPAFHTHTQKKNSMPVHILSTIFSSLRTLFYFRHHQQEGLNRYNHWRRTKVETTGATRDYKTLISRLFETFLDFKTKNKWCHGTSGTT